MTIAYHSELLQRSEEWYAARCGILTASDMKKIISPGKLLYADNATSRDHMADLCTQRINKYVEPSFQGFEMLRGYDDEASALWHYREHYGPVEDCGFVTNDEFGFTLGFSPDGLIGDDGIVEAKGKLPKLQLQIVLEKAMPDEFKIQVQTGLLVTRRKWCDFISYSNGFNMFVVPVVADLAIQDAIVAAATEFHKRLDRMMQQYLDIVKDKSVRLIPVERRTEEIGI